MQRRRVTDWPELLSLLQEASWNPALRRFRSPYVFRGQGTTAPLTTSLQRLSGDTRDIERHLVRAVRKYARGTAPLEDSVWSWLALGQHHGLPTRLLDWTYSPLVALHFVTANEERYDQDGLIWRLNVTLTNAALPGPVAEVLAHEGADVFTVEMLTHLGMQVAGDTLALDAGMGWLERLEQENGQPFLLFLDPPSLDQRIVQQSALFSLLSTPGSDPEAWLAEHSDAAQCIQVPAHLKWEIRDRLDQFNVTERTLFPDLGGLSQWLRRYYRTREDGRKEMEST
ncbi:FRG domain-containing protein [Deinococcus cavernae]|uniref:FRG domain-containing protein n=1 Tax=Deinococcus cavernae TaxID=2320857 RepID=A0A418VGT9_9DEIO|nr:FRG domain-containing protein [Deinococcus cavernae]RJF75331.1 FRG domain-containing protein [Deinococcus cavernae]